MATTGIESWAVDLAETGAIYPFQGSEVILVLLGVAAWIGWHVWQFRWEKQYHQDKIDRYGDKDNLRNVLDTYD